LRSGPKLQESPRGRPTSHLGSTSYLDFGTSPADEKEVARLRPEGSSLGERGVLKEAPSFPAACHSVASMLEAAGQVLPFLPHIFLP
ncbi:hypothetical protein P7K49_039302, partial [Saguinus oedipus]